MNSALIGKKKTPIVVRKRTQPPKLQLHGQDTLTSQSVENTMVLTFYGLSSFSRPQRIKED
jgi:hypothetical protein